MPQTCHTCDAALGPDDQFCGECGAEIHQAQAVSAPTASLPTSGVEKRWIALAALGLGVLAIYGLWMFAGDLTPGDPRTDTANELPTVQGVYNSTQKKMSFTCDRNGECTGSYSGTNDGKPASIISRFSPDGRMVGYWVETKSDNRCRKKKYGSDYWGKILFRFDASRNSWKGWWSYCDEEPNPNLKKRVWNGWR